jgi:hypothetical protein
MEIAMRARRDHRVAIGVAVVICGSLLLGAGWVSAQPTPHAALGAVVRASVGHDKAVAVIDNADITDDHIAMAVAMAQLNNALGAPVVDDSRRAALARVLESKALGFEAARRGLLPSAADVQQYVADMRSAFAHNPAAAAGLSQFLAGMGLNANQYFSDPRTIAGYADALAIARLRLQVSATVPLGQADAAWDQYRKDVTAKASIQILDSALR